MQSGYTFRWKALLQSTHAYDCNAFSRFRMPDSRFLILIDYDSRECAVLVFKSLHFPSFCPQFANPSNGVIGINYREVPCDSKPKHDLGPVGFPPGSPSPSLLSQAMRIMTLAYLLSNL